MNIWAPSSPAARSSSTLASSRHVLHELFRGSTLMSPTGVHIYIYIYIAIHVFFSNHSIRGTTLYCARTLQVSPLQ